MLGGDYLGGKYFEKAMLKAHPIGWAGGIFLTTFGDTSKTVAAMMKSGKFSEIVVHVAPFDNSHKYPISKLMPQIRNGAKWLEGLAVKYPSTKILLSPFCEHNHPAKDMAPVFKELRQIAPSCLMLNSIWKGEVVPDTITEIHLENSKKLPKKPKGVYTVSFDGFGGDGSGNYTDTNIEAILDRYADARHIRWWNFRCNGKFGWKDKTPLSQRNYWPEIHYLKGCAAMMKKREGAITWPKNALYKPFADDHGQGGKDNKALVILPSGGSQVEVLDSKGKVIDKMQRASTDHVGTPAGPRYYSNLYAYQLGDLAEKGTGSRLIQIKSGSKVYPLTDADVRSSLFR